MPANNYVKLYTSHEDTRPEVHTFDDRFAAQRAHAWVLCTIAPRCAVFRRPPIDVWDPIPEVGQGLGCELNEVE